MEPWKEQTSPTSYLIPSAVKVFRIVCSKPRLSPVSDVIGHCNGDWHSCCFFLREDNSSLDFFFPARSAGHLHAAKADSHLDWKLPRWVVLSGSHEWHGQEGRLGCWHQCQSALSSNRGTTPWDPQLHHDPDVSGIRHRDVSPACRTDACHRHLLDAMIVHSWLFSGALGDPFIEKTSPDFQLFSHRTIRAKTEQPQIYKK